MLPPLPGGCALAAIALAPAGVIKCHSVLVWPQPHLWFIKYFSVLHVEYESTHLLNLSVQNAVDCLSENFNLKNFSGGACTQNSLEKCAVRSPDGRYRTHIATVYYIFRPPLSQNPPSAPPWGPRVSALNSEYPLWNVSNWLCGEFGCSPYYRGVRYDEVSTWQELTTRFPNRW